MNGSLQYGMVMRRTMKRDGCDGETIRSHFGSFLNSQNLIASLEIQNINHLSLYDSFLQDGTVLNTPQLQVRRQ